jgi:hypothetical protein
VLTKATITRKLSASSDAAWDAIRAIGRLDVWFPAIASCRVEGRGPGAHRHMTLQGGGEMTDRVEAIDPTRRRLTYRRIRSPFPVSSYVGTVEVFESFDGCAVVVWTVDFESQPEVAANVAGVLQAAIGAGVAGMERDLEGTAS